MLPRFKIVPCGQRKAGSPAVARRLAMFFIGLFLLQCCCLWDVERLDEEIKEQMGEYLDYLHVMPCPASIID